jgi:signal peptidase II
VRAIAARLRSHGDRALRAGVLVVVAAAVIGVDQWSKSWAEGALGSGSRHVFGPLELVLTYNSGAAFSLGRGATPVVEVLSVALVALVMWQSGRLARARAGWALVTGFGLLSGGAVSNLADRLVRDHHGAVVDFIQVASWWPVFNLADAAITLGALTIAVKVVFSGRGERCPHKNGTVLPCPKGSGEPRTLPKDREGQSA